MSALPKHSRLVARGVKRTLPRLSSKSPLVDGTREDDVRMALQGVREEVDRVERLLSKRDVAGLKHAFGEIADWAGIARRNLT